EIGPDSVESWIESYLATVVPEVVGLCSDQALRVWLLDEGRAERDGRRLTSNHLRRAALLTRHLGLENEVPTVLALAQAKWLEERARAPIEPALQARFDRTKSRYPAFWSHERWLRWFDGAPA